MDHRPNLHNFIEGHKAGKFIYHYTKLDTALEKILPNQKLRLSPLENMNDPQESHGWSGILDRTPPVRLAYSEMPNVKSEFNEMLRKAVSKSKIGCFSASTAESYIGILTDGAGWCKGRMWAQYADNGRGVCLVFDKEKLVKMAKACFGEENVAARLVQYKLCNEIFNNLPEPHNLVAANLEGQVESYIIDNSDAIFFIKHSDWRDENEFRLLVRNTKGDETDLPILGLLVGIITGINFPLEVYKSLIKEWCEIYNCCYAKMMWPLGAPYIQDPDVG